MTTVGSPADPLASEPDDTRFRRRLLDGLAASINEQGYRNTTIADIVRRARTSRRTFYEYFSSKEDCFVALLTAANGEMIARILAAVDPAAPWKHQIRQAIEEWIDCAEAEPAIMLSWIRDVPALGDASRRLQRELIEAFVAMIETLSSTEEWRTNGPGPVPRRLTIMFLGGLRELTAVTVEDRGHLRDVTEVAVQASIALLTHRGATENDPAA